MSIVRILKRGYHRTSLRCRSKSVRDRGQGARPPTPPLGVQEFRTGEERDWAPDQPTRLFASAKFGDLTMPVRLGSGWLKTLASRLNAGMASDLRLRPDTRLPDHRACVVMAQMSPRFTNAEG